MPTADRVTIVAVNRDARVNSAAMLRTVASVSAGSRRFDERLAGGQGWNDGPVNGERMIAG